MKTEKIFEFEGSRNLNSSPIDITGLQGDTYDYELVTFFEVEGVGSDVNMTFNNDTGASSYRSYYMQGDGSSAAAAVKDTEPSVSVDVRVYSYPALAIIKISGDSSTERIVDILATTSVTSGDTRIKKQTNYWKNTVDEINSIQLSKAVSVTSNCHIILYRVPKVTSQGGWEKVGELTWAAESTEKSFTGLDGDRDKEYKIVWSGGNSYLFVEVNNDSSASYQRQRLINSSGSISAANNTRNYYELSTGELHINASTGSERLSVTSSSRPNVTQVQDEFATWYSDTSTNITSLDCTPSVSATGTAILYRKMTPSSTDVLSWELVESVDVSGNFTAGHTFNVEGDSTTLYKIEWLGRNTSSAHVLRMRINGDTGSNYIEQRLRGNASTASALLTTQTYFDYCWVQNGEESSSEMYLYPKSGENRPALSKFYLDEDQLDLRAAWWNNSLDPITSIIIYGSNTNALTGKLKLYRLK